LNSGNYTKETPRQLIGKNVKELRLKHNWTKTQMADVLDISVPTLSRIESGRTDICLSRLYQIADLFEVSVLQLFSCETKKIGPMSVSSSLTNARRRIFYREAEISNLRRKIIELHEELHREFKSKNLLTSIAET
jgi:transcriptional regulator with XRE-family HTH domain